MPLPDNLLTQDHLMANIGQEGHVASVAAKTGDHGEASFPPFDTVNFSAEFLWLALSFGALYLLMSKIALPRVHSILQARAHKISADIADAGKLHTQAEATRAAHDKLVNDAKSEALALAQETHAKLLAEAEARRSVLESELNAKLAASEAQITETKARAMSNVEAIAGEAAAAIVQRVTGRPADQDAIARAIAGLKA
jgi:F-type H+-transporting ATPase subunit b